MRLQGAAFPLSLASTVESLGSGLQSPHSRIRTLQRHPSPPAKLAHYCTLCIRGKSLEQLTSVSLRLFVCGNEVPLQYETQPTVVQRLLRT